MIAFKSILFLAIAIVAVIAVPVDVDGESTRNWAGRTCRANDVSLIAKRQCTGGRKRGTLCEY
jgi:hypothetical protein